MAPRSMWNGTVAFGEVVFPVKLYAVAQERRVRFREVHLADGGRILHKRFVSDSDTEVPSERIGRAFELSDGELVVIDEGELAAAHGPNEKVIRVEHFVPARQIDPIFYDRPYVLGAQAGGEQAYRLLQAALAKRQRVGIGRFTLRTREQLVALASHEGALRLYTMRFADQLVDSGELEVPTLGRTPTARELEMAERLVDTLAAPWRPEAFEDRHREAVLALIRQKAEGVEVVAEVVPAPAETPDLLAALEASLAGKPRRRRRAAHNAAPGRGAAAKPRTRSR